MNQKNNNLKSNKVLNNGFKNKSVDVQNHRHKIKLRLMNKYNLSSKEADDVLSEMEKKFEMNSVSKYQNSEINNSPSPKFDSDEEKYISKIEMTDMDSKNSLDSFNLKKGSEIKLERNHNIGASKQIIDYKEESIGNAHNNFNQEVKTKKINSQTKNVDSILEGIIPDYNQQISIKVDHIDLTFEVQNEKVDTLKETFIRTLKRDKSKKFKIHALKNVSFQIYKGEKVGIIGYNGAGKSTLLNVITGIYPPDKGTVTTYGKISPLLSLGAGFDHNFSGRQNIILNGAVLGYDREYLESKMDEIIEFSELGEFIDIPIKNYSSGMLAKLGFSIATIVEPDILIIDEILGVGDVNFKKKSGDKMKSLMDGGTTVLLVSHSIPQIRELCDKAIWIDGGKLREIGEVNKVCDNYLKDAEKASNEQLANIQFT